MASLHIINNRKTFVENQSHVVLTTQVMSLHEKIYEK